MSKTVTKFRFFFAHQDEEQEAWLRAMAQQGFHLINVNPLCFWTFRIGAPADIVYRLDFPGTGSDPAFAQLMDDAGWSLAAATVGWHYWRTPAVDGRVPEIFTDSASKAEKFRRLVSVLVVSGLPLFIILLTIDKQRAYAQLSVPSLVILGTIVSLYLGTVGYSVVRLRQRLGRLQGPLAR
ncbi:DUF2812 domain-containing protein [Massilia aurea]|uniref:DUF2812 domain-containing protein n=1 Tax=Massilia aurea TaxID=373040 RepID=UPI00346241E8